MDAMTAIKAVLKTTVANDALVRGTKACEEAIAGGRVRFCVIAVDCAEPASVVSLCLDRAVPLVKVPELKELRRWAGIGETGGDADATCVGVTRHANEHTEAYAFLMELLGSH